MTQLAALMSTMVQYTYLTEQAGAFKEGVGGAQEVFTLGQVI